MSKMFVQMTAWSAFQALRLIGSADKLVSILERLNEASRKLTIDFIERICSQESEYVMEEVRGTYEDVKEEAWSAVKLLDLVRCLLKRRPTKGEERSYVKREYCKTCKQKHRVGVWLTHEDVNLGLMSDKDKEFYRRQLKLSDAAKVLENAVGAEKVLKSKLSAMKSRFAAGEYNTSQETRDAATAEINQLKEDIPLNRGNLVDAFHALLEVVFPGAKLVKLYSCVEKGPIYLVGNDRKEMRAKRVAFLAARAMMKIALKYPEFSSRSPVTARKIEDAYVAGNGFITFSEFENLKGWLPGRLSRKQKQMFRLLNSWPGRERKDDIAGFVQDPDDSDAVSPVNVADDYGLLELYKRMGAVVRRNSVFFVDDHDVLIPTQVEIRNPELPAESKRLLVVNKETATKKILADNTYRIFMLRNDPRLIGVNKSSVVSYGTLSERGTEELVAKATAISYFWLSGEAQDGDLLPAIPAARPVRRPRPIRSRYIQALVDQAFLFEWDCVYHVTPIIQDFFGNKGLWLVVQNLSSPDERMWATRLTGVPAGLQIYESSGSRTDFVALARLQEKQFNGTLRLESQELPKRNESVWESPKRQ